MTTHATRSRGRWSRWAGLVAAAASVALVAGCAAGSAPEGTPSSADGGNLVVALSADPRSLMPNSSTVQAEINVSQQVTEKLVEFAAEGAEIEPRLATSWEQIDDTTLRMTLREGVTFTNGEAFNAESVAYSIGVLRDSPAYGSYTGLLADPEVVDDYTIDIKANTPTGQLLNSIARSAYQYPPKYFDEVGAEGFGNAPIGTGPFVFGTWSKGDSITLERNDDYWGEAAKLDSVEFKVIPDKSAQVAALQSGQIDFMTDVPTGSISTVENASNLELIERASDRMYYLTFSELTETPLQDPAVRRALWYALDPATLVEQQLGGMGEVLNGQIVTKNYFGYDESIQGTEYDPEKAKELLAEAGYPNGFSVTFKYSSGRYAQDVELGQAIAAQLAKVGVDVKQEVLESGTFLTQLLDLQLNDMYFGGSLTNPDAHYMYLQFASNAPYSYYRNDEFDALLAAETAEPDPAAREALLQEIAQMFLEDPPFVPLFAGVDTYGAAAGLEGFVPRASQFTDFATVTLAN